MNQYILIWIDNTLTGANQPVLLPAEYGEKIKLGSSIDIPEIYYALGILVAICDDQPDTRLDASQLKKQFQEYAINLLPKEEVFQGFTHEEAFVVDATDFARDELGFEVALKCGIGGYHIFPSNVCGMNLIFDWINMGKENPYSMVNETLLQRFLTVARNIFQNIHINDFHCDNKVIICRVYILCYEDRFQLTHFIQHVLPQVILTNVQREEVKALVQEKIEKSF